MIDFVVGQVTVVSPLEVSIDGAAGVRTSMAGTWTPTVAMRVLVAVNARTRARLYALGPITL